MDGHQNFVTRIQFIDSVTMVVTTINTTIKRPMGVAINCSEAVGEICRSRKGSN
jgi:hypothetical protein